MAGTGFFSYFSREPFTLAGIDVRVQDYTEPVYTQLHGDFEPKLSAVDVLLNCGNLTT